MIMVSRLAPSRDRLKPVDHLLFSINAELPLFFTYIIPHVYLWVNDRVECDYAKSLTTIKITNSIMR